MVQCEGIVWLAMPCYIEKLEKLSLNYKSSIPPLIGALNNHWLCYLQSCVSLFSELQIKEIHIFDNIGMILSVRENLC